MNNDNVSLVAVKYYSDYDETQSQFITKDGLRVLTSTHQTNFLNVKNIQITDDFVLDLAGNDPEKVIDYNELRGVEIDTKNTFYNKDKLDIHNEYNKAIILSEDNATIVQLVFKNGTSHLTNMDKVKLINDKKAKEDSLKNYALSLVGDENNVVYYDAKAAKSN